jgi:hypothetical protein
MPLKRFEGCWGCDVAVVAGVADCDAAALVPGVVEALPPNPKRPPPFAAVPAPRVWPEVAELAPNKLVVDGTGAAGVVDPNKLGFDCCGGAALPKRPPDGAAAPVVDGGVAAGVVLPKLNAGFAGAGVAAPEAVVAAGLEPNKFPA